MEDCVRAILIRLALHNRSEGDEYCIHPQAT